MLPQLGSVPGSDWLSKRATGALNYWWERKGQFALTPRKLERLADFAREQAVDAVLCTGDYTLWGTEREHENARLAVQPLVDAADIFVTVPGNHDVYTRRVVTERRFERHFGDLLGTDLPESCVDGPWPIVRFLGEDAVAIAVNSSVPHGAPWTANGTIPDAQLDEVERLLERPDIRERFVFVMTHHAPRRADGSNDPEHHGLVNADRFLDVCSRIPRGAVLFGHIHRTYTLKLPDLEATLFNAGSATLTGREGLWLFDITPTAMEVQRGRWKENRYVLRETS